MKNFITVKKNLTSNKKIFEKTIKCNNKNLPMQNLYNKPRHNP